MTTTARGKALRASPFAPYEFDHKKRKEVTEQGKAYTYPQPTITTSASTPGSRFKRRGGSVLLRRGHTLELLQLSQPFLEVLGYLGASRILRVDIGSYLLTRGYHCCG